MLHSISFVSYCIWGILRGASPLALLGKRGIDMTKRLFFIYVCCLAQIATAGAFMDICASSHKSPSQSAFFENVFAKTNTSSCQAAFDKISSTKSLSLDDSRIHDLSPLEGFHAITSIDIESANLWDISALGTLENLRFLILENTGPVDFQPLRKLQSLKSVAFFHADNVYLEDNLAILQRIPSLTDLYLRAMQLSDVSQAIIGKMTQLRVLHITTAPSLRDIEFLRGLKGLTVLNISGTNVVDIAPIATFTALKSLWLVRTPVSDLAPLAQSCGQLVSIALHQSLVSDFTPLRSCKNAKVMWLSGLHIRDIPDLSHNPRLSQLSLDRNLIADLTPLAAYKSITYLNLEHNAITDLSPLKDLSSLTRLRMVGNPLGTTIPKIEANCPTDGSSAAVTAFCQP